jgi:hypothetical protein
LRFVVGGSHGWRAINALFSQAKFVVSRGIFKANEQELREMYDNEFLAPTLGATNVSG